MGPPLGRIRRRKRYMPIPPRASRIIWKIRNPLGTAKRRTSGKKAAHWVSPRRGAPLPS